MDIYKSIEIDKQDDVDLLKMIFKVKSLSNYVRLQMVFDLLCPKPFEDVQYAIEELCPQLDPLCKETYDVYKQMKPS